MVETERSLRAMTAVGALLVVVTGALLLALATGVEWRRRHDAESRLVRLADRLLPAAARRVAVVLIGSISTMTAIGVAPASADTSLRDWLDTPTTSTTIATATTTTTPAPLPPAPRAVGTLTPAGPIDTPRPTVVVSGPTTSTPPPTPSAPTVAATSPPRSAGVTTPAPEAPHVTDPPVSPSAPAPAYRIEPGDCLWSIAAGVLGNRASDIDVDRGWRAIYAANRSAIGADPNLIHPGLTLVIPELVPTP